MAFIGMLDSEFFLWREIHLKYVDFSDALSRPVRILEVPGPGTPPRGTVEVRGPPFGVARTMEPGAHRFLSTYLSKKWA